MLAKAVTAMFVLVGIVNFLPLAGVLGVARMESAYGVVIEGADMAVLMRHRAVLFGIVGGFIIASAFVPDWRQVAVAMALISMLSFIALAWTSGPVGAPIMKLAHIDTVAAVVCLLAWVGDGHLRQGDGQG